MSAEENLQRMKTLDDAWNAQDWEVFRKRHTHDTTVHWPGQPDPTRGIDNHQAESVAFFKSIEKAHCSFTVAGGDGSSSNAIIAESTRLTLRGRHLGCRS